MESTLRGIRGQRVTHLDTGEEQVIAPVAGRDVHLTLDIALQMRVQALMSHDPAVGLMRSQEWHHAGDSDFAPQIGDPLNGAAIVLDVDNGEVLAAVSVPGVTLADFGERSQRQALRRPTQRAVAGAFRRRLPGTLRTRVHEQAAGPRGRDHRRHHRPRRRNRLHPGLPLGEQTQTSSATGSRSSTPRSTLVSSTASEALTVSSNVFFGRLAQGFGQKMSYNRFVWWFKPVSVSADTAGPICSKSAPAASRRSAPRIV